MTEKFRIAANFLLKRRLNHLVRIDNNVEIDRTYVTCAEYQLFIDDLRQESKNLQPYHWKSERFPQGDAKEPITGVRISDAKAFCEWLTQKEKASFSGFRYRLPTVDEVYKTKESLVTKDKIGFWCINDDIWVISGIKSQKWQIWQKQLSKYLILRDNFNLSLSLYRDFHPFGELNRDLQPYRNYYLQLYQELDRHSYPQLYQELYLYRVLDRGFYQDLKSYQHFDEHLLKTLDRHFNLNLHRNFYLNLNRHLNRYLNPYRDFYLQRYRDLDFNLDRDLYSSHYQEIDSGRASKLLLIYFPLIFFIIFYQLLTTIYREVAHSRKARKTIKLSRQKCEKMSKEYAQKRDEIYQLYVYLVLIDERQKGNMPAWEGIRIVREREEID